MKVELCNRQTALAFDAERLCAAARRAAADEGFTAGALSLTIVDDAEMHDLNLRWLAHDYPTDVLSFVLEREPPLLEGEVIASADTAAAIAQRLGWRGDDELLLYIVHGVLHLAGYDDQTPAERTRMLARQREILREFGVEPPHDDAGDAAAAEQLAAFQRSRGAVDAPPSTARGS